MRKRAIANWNRLKIILVIMKLVKASSLTEDRTALKKRIKEKDNDDDKEVMTCDKRMMPFIFTPVSITSNIFNLCFGVIIALSITQDLVIVAFRGALLYYRSQFIAESIFTCLLCVNVIVQFFMGFEKKTDITIEREDVEDPIFDNQKTSKV
jgi:hypothetical protein